MKNFDILEAKKVYAEGGNVSDFLRSQKKTPVNTSEIIETAYDLQAGSYIEFFKNNGKKVTSYVDEISDLLKMQLGANQTMLDIGTGELTTLLPLLNNLSTTHKKILACDIS